MARGRRADRPPTLIPLLFHPSCLALHNKTAAEWIEEWTQVYINSAASLKSPWRAERDCDVGTQFVHIRAPRATAHLSLRHGCRCAC